MTDIKYAADSKKKVKILDESLSTEAAKMDMPEAEATAEEAQETQRIDELEKLVAEMTEKGDELLANLQRERADFENYRRRSQSGISEAYANAKADVVIKLLPVLDNFDRALNNTDEEDPFVKGVTMVYRQLKDILAALGVNEIEALNKEFDPNIHDAAMQEEVPGAEPGIICDVFSRGYIMGDRILRHPTVKVAK